MKDFLKHHITCHSNKVKKGSIFVAIEGVNADGHNHIKEAAERGASLIVINKQKTHLQIKGSKYKIVQDTKAELTRMLKKVFSQPKHIVAITGTNGKTSTACFFQQIANLLKKGSASIGTLGVISNKNVNAFKKLKTLTTPNAIDMAQILDQLKTSGVEFVGIEASSHGLDQRRLRGVKIKAAAWTSFSQDHLDYHKTMGEYKDAKLKLFSEYLIKSGTAVINSDMEVTNEIIAICKKRKVKYVTYGSKKSDVQVTSIIYKPTTTHVEFLVHGKKFETELNVIGDFQVHNVICALCLAVACKLPLKACIKALPKLKSPLGRMQKCTPGVFIDYSHTPDALQNALMLLKSTSTGKVIVVFGCGGDRDALKRPMMGKVANKFADTIIVTDDNPRNEDPNDIRKSILAAAPQAIDIGDRRQAIEHAISLKNKNDVVLIAGKGHETYQITGDKVVDFDDAKIAQEFHKKKTIPKW